MLSKVYIIDPDVWRLSFLEPRCHVAVQDIWERLERHGDCLALDGDQVEREYMELLQSSDLPDDLRQILHEIFNIRVRSDKIRTLQPISSPKLDDKLQSWECKTPVEPVLIRMAAVASGVSPELVLVGNDRCRPRGLHQSEHIEKLRQYFRKELRKSVGVIYATQIALPGRNESELGYQRRVFEDQVRFVLIDRVSDKTRSRPYSMKPTPSEVENYKDPVESKKAGEIDVYLYIDLPEGKRIWICECELREAGNEDQPITEEKVLQLRRKVEAVKAFEEAQGKTAVVKGFMVTNAQELLPAARIIVDDNKFQFCHVTMPKKWATDFRWCLQDKDVGPLDL